MIFQEELRAQMSKYKTPVKPAAAVSIPPMPPQHSPAPSQAQRPPVPGPSQAQRPPGPFPGPPQGQRPLAGPSQAQRPPGPGMQQPPPMPGMPLQPMNLPPRMPPQPPYGMYASATFTDTDVVLDSGKPLESFFMTQTRILDSDPLNLDLEVIVLYWILYFTRVVLTLHQQMCWLISKLLLYLPACSNFEYDILQTFYLVELTGHGLDPSWLGLQLSRLDYIAFDRFILFGHFPGLLFAGKEFTCPMPPNVCPYLCQMWHTSLTWRLKAVYSS